ncbi:hypothetical protein GCK72_015437 [Caenorhabditis remanei]|uniref:F-box domain-containing protein n=1 Tax=Caenorhabditis remanei TaxID=31234 RepID=A0A6A5GUY6_CAERE|nr:hypothetical protein GCK72_015437 [Caenorhabditis remanei]KAF1758977.1 hypothetical protein GCK72_015437 [Caenorhabditis remanei]
MNLLLPIFRLPFRAMEQVSKALHSIINMISNRRSNKFPILRLPFLAIEEIFKAMDPFEIINFSMTSKRAKIVTKAMVFNSKYVICVFIDTTLGIAINGTKNRVSCVYEMTSDKQMDGKTEEDKRNRFITRKAFKYSKDPVEEWKQLCKHVLEIFKKQSIDRLTMTMDAFVDHNVSIIDFLRTNVNSVEKCNLWHSEDENDVDEHAAYFLDKLKVSNELYFYLKIKNDNFNGKIPKNLNELYLPNSHWIGYEKLLDIDCKHVVLTNDRIWEEEWNLFIKKWIAMETNQNLEYMELDNRNLDIFRIHVLYDIPHEVVDDGVKRILKTRFNQNQEFNGGIDIRRIDGKTATLCVCRIFGMNRFAMRVH